MAKVLSVAVVVLALAAPRAASADSDAARQHFETGKKLRDDGDCTKAIPEFEKSIAADKSIGGYYNLAYCQEQLGNRQLAYDAYKQARDLASSKHDPRAREIGAAVTSLLDTPNVRLVLPQPLPPGFTVRVDDHLVPNTLYDAEIVVFTEPANTHTVVAVATGYDEWRATVETKQRKEIELHHASPLDADTRARERADVADNRAWNWQHWTGLGLGVAGIVVIGVDVVTGIPILSKYIANESHYRYQERAACGADGNPACTQDELKAQQVYYNQYGQNEDYARQRELPLIAPLLIGGVLVAGGAYLFFVTAPKASPSTRPSDAQSRGSFKLVPLLDASRRGLVATGTF